ncbi:MAG TPA: hypothetical protein VGG62_10610 [Terracidiphilus sp.]|jgi:hypothetical protein
MKRRKPRNYRTDAEKEQILREAHAAVEAGGSSRGYAEEHGLSSSWLYKLQQTYPLSHPGFKLEGTKELSLRADLAGGPLDDLKREYQSLPRKNGVKSAFLQKYGVNHQQMWEWIHRHKIPAPLRHMANAEDLRVVKTVPSEASANGAEHVTVRQLFPMEVQAPVPMTLADAIGAMEMKRDQLTGFIEDLKRMQRGQRQQH